MSHFTRIRTQLRDLQVLRRSLTDLGYSLTEGNVVGYGGQHTQTDLVVKQDNGPEIGFRKEGQQIVLVADFWGSTINRDEFLGKVCQRYAYLTVLEQTSSQGWQSVAEEVQPDGSIRLVMQRWK